MFVIFIIFQCEVCDNIFKTNWLIQIHFYLNLPIDASSKSFLTKLAIFRFFAGFVELKLNRGSQAILLLLVKVIFSSNNKQISLITNYLFHDKIHENMPNFYFSKNQINLTKTAGLRLTTIHVIYLLNCQSLTTALTIIKYSFHFER